MNNRFFQVFLFFHSFLQINSCQSSIAHDVYIKHETISWPPHSPDFTHFNFLLWRCVKCYVFRTSVNDIGTIHASIIKAIQSVVGRMLTCTSANTNYQLDVIRVPSWDALKHTYRF
jgi:hypothetical protein